MRHVRQLDWEPDLEDFGSALRYVVAAHTLPGESLLEYAESARVFARKTVELDVLESQWQRLPSTRRLGLLSDAVTAIGAAHKEQIAGDSAELLPAVRPTTLLDTAPFASSHLGSVIGPEYTVPRRTIGGNLHWVLVDETPVSLRLVDKDDLAEWNQSFDRLLDTAMANFPIRPVDRWASIEDSIFSPAVEDEFLATRVLHPRGLDEIPFSGEAVLFLPTRSTVIIAPASNQSAVARAAELTQFFVDMTQPLSLVPLIGENAQWRAFSPPADHRAHDACARLAAIDEVAAAEYQRAILTDFAAGDVHLVPLQLLDADDADGAGIPVSVCTWSEHSPALLPHADVVAFSNSGEDMPFLVPWEAVLATCGHRLTKTQHRPTRYLTYDYPTASEIATLYSLRLDTSS